MAEAIEAPRTTRTLRHDVPSSPVELIHSLTSNSHSRKLEHSSMPLLPLTDSIHEKLVLSSKHSLRERNLNFDSHKKWRPGDQTRPPRLDSGLKRFLEKPPVTENEPFSLLPNPDLGPILVQSSIKLETLGVGKMHTYGGVNLDWSSYGTERERVNTY